MDVIHGGSISFKRLCQHVKHIFDSNFILFYHIMNELVNYLHILILGTFSLLIKPKFVLTTHNNNKKISINVFFIGKFSSNFDLENMISTFTKDLSGKNGLNLLDFQNKNSNR
jgi:hypothetical protein